MNPVIQRELRAEARRPVSYWLRMGTAAAFFVLLELSLHGLDRVEATCRVLFPLLHGLLLMVSTCVAPLLIVEALSREKREGTFELLLLTPLTLDQVLSAKTFVFAVRTLVLVIGAFPVITFTLLFGGVAQEEVLLLVLVQASAVVLALSVGLLAAAWGRTWIQSLGRAGILLAVGGGGMSLLLFIAFQYVIGDTFARDLWPHPQRSADWVFGAVRLLVNRDGIWSETIGTIPRTLTPALLWLFGSAFLVAVFLAVLLRAAARAAIRNGLDREPQLTARRAGVDAGRFWAVPSHRRRRWLRGNPVRWLMRYPRDVRLVRWAGAGVVAGVQGVIWILAPKSDAGFLVQIGLALALAVLLALAAAGSYRREREDGSLEMLLVTPLTASHLLRGRVAGLWWQFGPAFVAWAGVLFWMLPHRAQDDRDWALAFWMSSLFLAVPVIGLESAFQFRTFWRAGGAVLFGSVGITGLLLWMGFMEDRPGFFCGLGAILLFVAAALCGSGFTSRLTLRRNGENLRSHRHRRRRRVPNSNRQRRVPA